MGSPSGIKQTAAYKIIREMVDHGWDSDTRLEKEEVVSICKTFSAKGGSWESYMSGDFRQFTLLEDIVKKHMKNRQDPEELDLDQVAFNLMMNMF